ncbi:MAG: bifunctional anthranilate synthase component I family protein/class IV aminotransferase, partial [Magnetococcales bacterium]|nr:bifunctional anthranilate synthase component I family protein/class IV aminotransferase [Magnetococcales bacterium]
MNLLNPLFFLIIYLNDVSALIRIAPEQLWDGVTLLVDFPELGAPLFFSHPRQCFIAKRPEEVSSVLQAAETAALAGYWVGGLLTYEASAAFGLPVFSPQSVHSPLAWFAVFDAPQPICYPALALHTEPPTPTLSRNRYCRDLLTIAERIQAGESYQVNYTLPMTLCESVDPAVLFLHLQRLHRFPRAMWVHDAEMAIASLSPETFLQRHNDSLLTAPIKGTRPRGKNSLEDILLGEALENSAKDRAEHIMIVDMARNDLGKICQTGSVTVESLLARRSFSTVHHLESCVQGRLMPEVNLTRIMEAMFPAASITGAPKQRTMEIIRDLEERNRGVYTGAMGVMRPGGDFYFNVAIRTVVWSAKTGCVMGLGGGVVADSDANGEWAEIGDKGRFLSETPLAFDLIETFLVDGQGNVPKLARHLARMQASALALGFEWDDAQAKELVEAWLNLAPKSQIGRLQLASEGRWSLSHRPLHPWPDAIIVRVALWRPDPMDRLSRHKTTRRFHLDEALTEARQAGYDEVLFVNATGNLSEGAITAILVCLQGCWYAPLLEDGLLPSLWRESEMARLQAKTKQLTLADLVRAEAIRMGNAARGGVSVKRLDDAQGKV